MNSYQRYKRLPTSQINIGRVSFRFWQKTKRKANGCLEWQGVCDSEGYARTSVFHRDYRAARLAYYLFYSVDPDRKLVLHRCDNPKCVNPHHLFLGTQKDNIRDMDAKNRRTKVYLKGERSGRAILTARDVKRIRQSKKTTAQLARDYGVSVGCIDHARRGLNWKHLK